MEEEKVQRLHDSLSKLRKGKGLGTNSSYSWNVHESIPLKKDKHGNMYREDGLPVNGLYANFLKSGTFDPKKAKENSALKYGDGRAIKRNFDDIEPISDGDKGREKKKKSKEERKAEKKAKKLEEKKKVKLEEKRRLKLEAKKAARGKEAAKKEKELVEEKPAKSEFGNKEGGKKVETSKKKRKSKKRENQSTSDDSLAAPPKKKKTKKNQEEDAAPEKSKNRKKQKKSKS